MLWTRMDLLNSHFLDKMNNNIGTLHYDDKCRIPSLSTAVSTITGPSPHCPNKRKYGDEQMENSFNCDDDHMTKMSKMFATHLARPSAGDDGNEHWSVSNSPMEHVTSSSNGVHRNHPYASISGCAIDPPLAPSSYSDDRVLMPGGSTERQQNRPSVITCAPASNRNCNLSHCHMNGPTPPEDQRQTNSKTECDPVIEEHFRRSLGENYKETDAVSNSVSITGSVDDHFAKALGETWLKIQARGTSHQSLDDDYDDDP